MKITISFIYLFCFISLNIFSQDSWVKEMPDHQYYEFSPIANEEGEVVYGGLSSFIEEEICVFCEFIPNQPDTLLAHKFNVSDQDPSLYNNLSYHQDVGAFIVFLDNSLAAVTYNFETGSHFVVGHTAAPGMCLYVGKENSVYIGAIEPLSTLNSNRSISLYRLASTGETIWAKGLNIYTADSLCYNSGVSNEPIGQFSDGSLIILASLSLNAEFYGSAMLKIDDSGNVLALKIVKDYQLKEVKVDSEDKILVAGWTNLAYDFTETETNLLVAKFDSQLEIEWSNVYHAEQFRHSKTSLNLSANNELTISYGTFGAYPTILARLNDLGDIIWQKGYPFYSPLITTLPNGALIFTANKHFDEAGNLFNKLLFGKTDSLGNIESCGELFTCLQSHPIILEFGEGYTQSAPYTDLIDVEHEVVTSKFALQDFCDVPPQPSPEFEFPDTLCLYDCAETTNTNNIWAHAKSFQLTGNNVDSLLQESENFSYCFAQPGEYELTQTIWLLGCDYTFSKKITVLDSLIVDIFPTDVVCETPPINVEVTSTHNVNNWLWSNGSTQSELLIFESDIVAVTVSDGYCVASDTAMIHFHSETIDGDLVLNFTTKQTLCQQNLPLTLMPESAYSDEFSLDGINFSTDSLSFTATGIYPVYAKIDDCVYQKDLEIIVEDCIFPAYFPNVFSPNQDGINDYFYPQGDNITSLELLIFDRWGSLVYDNKSAFPKWDGKLNGQPVKTGIYVWFSSYRNELTGEVFESKGEVLVVR